MKTNKTRDKDLNFWSSIDKALIEELCRIKGIRVVDMPYQTRLDAIRHYNLSRQSSWR
jgi:hypothetical protein